MDKESMEAGMIKRGGRAAVGRQEVELGTLIVRRSCAEYGKWMSIKYVVLYIYGEVFLAFKEILFLI